MVDIDPNLSYKDLRIIDQVIGTIRSLEPDEELYAIQLLEALYSKLKELIDEKKPKDSDDEPDFDNDVDRDPDFDEIEFDKMVNST